MCTIRPLRTLSADIHIGGEIAPRYPKVGTEKMAARQKDIEIEDSPNETLSFKYSITSYGTDFDVEGLVRRIEREDIYVPSFQREFVWQIEKASRFIESLLLGLPVPGIFLSRDGESKLLVIDGQQRLLSLSYFFDGIFGPTKSEFALKGLKSRFEGLTYKRLDPNDVRQLNDSIIHATIVRQDQPDDGNSSIYLIFERLNTGGMLLQPQEIRKALFHGPFIRLLDDLNHNSDWRELFGRLHTRQRDQELILRFLALYYWFDRYERPMKGFLNDFAGANRQLELKSGDQMTDLFVQTVAVIHQNIGVKAFKPNRPFNAAIFDSIMVGVARNIMQGRIRQEQLKLQYEKLLANPTYQQATETGTTDDEIVRRRINLATEAFEALNDQPEANK
jgi:hypothetical protein